MQVGLGPGMRADQVEFVAGPSTDGAWLFAQGDVLVAKVTGPGATLILTSIRSATGEALTIEVGTTRSARPDGSPAEARTEQYSGQGRRRG